MFWVQQEAPEETNQAMSDFLTEANIYPKALIIRSIQFISL